MNVTAYTANRVTGSVGIINWNGFKSQWPHLVNIDFPYTVKQAIVDVRIGLDCAELHCANLSSK